MKSATKFELSKTFWNREKPDGLKKSDKKFESAIETYVKALEGLRKPSEVTLKSFDTAESGLKAAAGDVISEAEKLAAGLKKDKKKKEPYDNTVSVLKKPLAKILADNRKTYESAAGSLNGAANDFATDALHGAYLKKEMGKLKRRPLNFALALQSNKPSEMRFCFHPSKGGRALVGPIKKALKEVDGAAVKKFTFGTAAAGSVSDGAPEDEAKARILQLDIAGKMIPGLARRVQVMLRQLGITAFGKVKILVDGQELESADETTPDELDALDLDTPDPEIDAIDDTVSLTADTDAPDEPTARGDGGASPSAAGPSAGSSPPAAPTAGGQSVPEPDLSLDEMRKKLLEAYAGLATEIKDAIKAAASNKDKIDPLAKDFSTKLKSGDIKAAAAALEALSAKLGELRGASTVALQSAKDAAGLVSRAHDRAFAKLQAAAGEAAKAAGEGLKNLIQGVGDSFGILSDADKAQKERLKDTGLSDAEQLRLVQANRDDPQAITKALATIQTLKSAGVPPTRRGVMLTLSSSNPAAYTATLDVLKRIDPGTPPLDVAAGPTAAAVKALTDKRAEREAKSDEWSAQKKVELAAKKTLDTKTAAETAARTARDEAKAARDAAQATLTAAEEALRQFDAANPDGSALTAVLIATRAGLAAAVASARGPADAANAALATAETKLRAASEATRLANEAHLREDAKLTQIYHQWDPLNRQVVALEAKQKKIDDKRRLLNAIAHGPLSASARKPLDKDSVTKLITAYGRDPDFGADAMRLAANSPNGAAVAANAGYLLDKIGDGFADRNGTALPASVKEADRKKMALNAMKMGARRGDAYFEGLKKYYHDGKQHSNDSTGGMTDPLAPPNTKANLRKERERKTEIATKRSTLMARAILDEHGKIKLDTTDTKTAMEQMLYHPGSLKTSQPALVRQFEQVQKTLADPSKGPQAQALLDGIGTPPNATAKRLVAGTTGGSASTVTATDAKTAVMSAMLTPLAQGPVGSCFTTAPARAIRQLDPIEAMRAFTGIVKTGVYTPKHGTAVQAVTDIPRGENPILRSWEYSAATVAANRRNSIQNNRLNKGLFGSAIAGKDLDRIKDVVGAAAWNGGSRDPVTNAIDPGIKNKLKAAIFAQLKFYYNAAPRAPSAAGGGGDGSSTDGGYELRHNGNPIRSQADFLKAIKAIALQVTGETEETAKGRQIVAIITDPDFIKGILESRKTAAKPDRTYKPWDLSAGGFEADAQRVLTGRNETNVDFTAAKASASTQNTGERTKEVLMKYVAAMSTKTADMAVMGTTGDGANHAFNGLPNHPSLAQIKSPNTAAKIDAVLIEPAKKLATTTLEASRTQALFEEQIRRMMRNWGGGNKKLLAEALAKPPARALTPPDLEAHMLQVLKSYIEESAKYRANKWKAKREKKGETVSAADLTKKIAEFEKLNKGWLHSELGGALVNARDVPQVVIADTNWGGAEDHQYFVVAPDPLTGTIALYKKSEIDGTLELQGENWINAKWDRLD